MLGFVTRRRYETDLTAARAEAARQRKRADNAETSARTWQATAETAARQFAEADSANRRLAGRNNALAERLEAVQTASGFDRAQAKATADRIARLQRAVARARHELAAAPARARAEVNAELHREKSAHAALDEQCRLLQSSNEAQIRELYDLRVNGVVS
jgi:hypothetical protein